MHSVQNVSNSIVDSLTFVIEANPPLALTVIYVFAYLGRDGVKGVVDSGLHLISRGSDSLNTGLGGLSGSIEEHTRLELAAEEMARATRRLEEVEARLQDAQRREDAAKIQRLERRLDEAERRIANARDMAASADAKSLWRSMAFLRETHTSVFMRGFAALILSAFVVAVAWFNFFLLAEPMQQVLGTTEWYVPPVGIVSSANFGAVGIICIEILIGFALFEVLGFTNLFEIGAHMARLWRIVLAAVLFAFMLLLSYCEAGLAVSREELVVLSDAAQGDANVNPMLALTVNIIIGALMPWFMALAAWPIEILLKDFKHALRLVFAALLKLLALPFALIGFFFRWISEFFWAIYFAIFVAVPQRVVQFVGGIYRDMRGRGAEA